MAVEAGTAYVRIKPDLSHLNAELARNIDPIAKRFGGRFGKTLGPVMAQQSKHFNTFRTGAKYAAVGGAGLAVVVGRDLVQAGMKYEKQVSANIAISEANRREQAKLERQSIQLGKATFFSASEAAEAQGELLKGGLSIQQVLGGGLPAALRLAEAGELNLATAAETTVNAMKLFDLEGKEAGSVADMLATAANKTTADVLDYAMAMKQGGSVTKLAGYEMNETVAVLESLAESGIKNSDAGTSMKAAVIQLLKPTEKQEKLARLLGIHWENQNGELKSAAGLSKELRIATEGMTKSERAKTLATLAGTDGVRTLNALYSETPAHLRALEKANAKQGTAQEIARKRMDNLAGSWEQFKGSLETGEILIYKGMAPALTDLADEATAAANRVASVFEDPELSGSEKVEKAIDILSEEVGDLWDEHEMTEHLVDVLEAAIPIVAEHAGRLGLASAEAFGKGFLRADFVGKAVMAAWALHFIGGNAPFIAIGKSAGRVFGIEFATAAAVETAAANVAGTAVSASTAAAASSGAMVMGAQERAAADAARRARLSSLSAFGERKALEDAGLIGAATLTSRLKGALSKALRGAGALAGGYFAAEFGAKAIDGLTGADLLENQDLKTALTHGFNTSGVLGTEVNALQEAEGFDPTLAQAQIESLEAHFRKTMAKIQSSAALGLAGVNRALGTGLEQADRLWRHGTAPWRKHTTDAMRAAVREIRKGIDAGVIPAEKGQKRISALLGQIRLRKGSDPFGLAKATVSSFQQTNTITAAGVAQWMHKLDEMPKAAREKSMAATNAMLRAWAQGHPKLEAQINNLTALERKKFSTTNSFLERDTANAMAHIAQSAQEGAGNVGGALSNIFDNLANALAAVGSSKIPTFSLSTLSMAGQYHHTRETTQNGLGGRPQGKQTGGFVVPGTGSGDTFKTMVPAGSFVENREAVRRLPFQAGGKVPVMLEPGERVHYPAAVKAIGEHVLEARNRAVPRFQGGGLVHPKLQGPDPVRAVGQAAIDHSFKAAQRYLRKHLEPPRILRALRAMEAQAAKGYPYVYGGGHGSFSGPFDCSGYVSYGLGPPGAGFISAPMSVQQGSGLYTLGEAGPGKFLSWGVRGSSGMNAHTMMAIKAPGNKWKYFESGSGHGAAEVDGWSGAFQLRHIPGFQRGGKVPDQAKEQIARYGQKAFDPKSKHFVGWGYQLGGLVQKLQKGGFTKGNYTVKGLAASEVQKHVAKEIMEAADVKGALRLPRVASMMAATQENNMEPHNVFQLTGSFGGVSPSDPPYKQALRWFDEGYWHGGGIGLSKQYSDPGDIAQQVEGSAYPDAYDPWKPEGQKWASGWSRSGVAGGDSDEHSFKEDVPAVYKGVKTGSIDFPPVPKNQQGLARELTRWRKEAKRYRLAKKAAEKANRPGVAQAIGHNLTDIETHLRKLQEEMHKVRLDKARKKFSKRVKRKLSKVEGYEQVIEGLQRDFDISAQNAEQVVALEPQMPELPEGWSDDKKEAEEKGFVERLGSYVDNQETGAYGDVLGRLASLRNAILKAETFGFGEGKPSVARMESTSEKKVYEVATEIENINAYTERVTADIAAYKQQHPKAKGLPDWIKNEIKERDKKREKLPFLRTQERELRQLVGELREKFYPGDPDHNRIVPPALPLEGTGSLEETLIGVQGTHWPDLHELLPASALKPPRVVGRFGGDIWEVQTSIEELGLKKAQAAGGLAGAGSGDEGDSDNEALLRELLTQANQEKIVREIERRVLGSRDEFVQRQLGGLVGNLPPYAGKAHTGAVVPGPRTQERTMILRGGEGILTEDQRDWLLEGLAGTGRQPAGLPPVVVNVFEDTGEVEVEYGEKKVEATVNKLQRRQARNAGRRRAGVRKSQI